MTLPSAPTPPEPSDSLDILAMLGQLRSARTEIQKLRAQLVEAKQQDAATGLPNRLLLTDRTDQAILQAQRQDQMVAILFIELDRFKTINQTLVFEERDELLQQLGRRLLAPLRVGDTLARVGGDQFAVLLPGLRDPLMPSGVARDLLEALQLPFRIGPREVHMTASLGVSLYPQDGADSQTLQKQAESAANRAKAEGGNCVRCTTPTLSEAFLERRELETYLGEAIAGEKLHIYYQPQYDTDDLLIGVEALLRWDHPILGGVPPSKIIPLAEEHQLIHAMGEWVLRTACRQVAAWEPVSPRPLRLAVNVSAQQVTYPGWVDTIARALRDSKLPPMCLELELTESSLLKTGRQGHAPLQELKDMGVRIGIDDFGTGYSSLSYLHRLPIHTLKIDQSFVAGLHPERSEGSSEVIVQTILQLGQNLGLDVVAEGVETLGQRELLRRMGCRLFQGFLLGRPMMAEDLARVLETQQALAFQAVMDPRRRRL